MKSIFFRFGLILLVVSLLAGGMVSQSLASTPSQFKSTPTVVPTRTISPTPAIQVAPGIPVDTLSFERLKIPDTALLGPYDSMTVDFSLPPNWRLLSGTELRLIISSSAVSGNGLGVDKNQTLGATLDVYFNSQLVTSLVLEQGNNKEYRIPIPTNALRPEGVDGQHSIYLFLNAGIDCDFTSHKTTVVVGSQSKTFLAYVVESLPLDIGLLPRPIFQKEAIFPSQAAIIVPKRPSEEGLRAGLIVSAGLGRMTNGELGVIFITADEFTEEIRENYHLIFVGKPEDFVLLTPFEWPARIINNSIVSGGLQDGDGVLQMITSPWNPGRTILWVGGNSDIAVVKAAQALSTGAVRPLAERNKVIIADTKPFEQARTTSDQLPVEYTFADLGYGVEKMSGTGFNQVNYKFYVLPGMVPSERPYIDLNFSNSSLMKLDSSGMVVSVNNVQVASEQLDETTSTLTTKRITIPSNLIRMGSNTITIEATLVPSNQCSLFTVNSLWMTIYPDSILHIPLMPAPSSNSSALVINGYPEAFTSYPNLQNIAVVVPQDSSPAWGTTARVLYHLGTRAQGALFEFGTYYDGKIPDGIREGHDLFFIGLPDDLPSMEVLNTYLPVPFEAGNNGLTVVQGQNISYRVPSDVPLGYLELLPSPWGQGYTILTILGSDAQGLGWSGAALVNPDQKEKMFGNFAVVSDGDIISIDTRTNEGLSGLTAGLGAIATPVVLDQSSTPTPQAPSASGLQGLLTRTDYIPYVVAVIILGMIGVLFWVYLSSRIKKKR